MSFWFSARGTIIETDVENINWLPWCRSSITQNSEENPFYIDYSPESLGQLLDEIVFKRTDESIKKYFNYTGTSSNKLE